MRQALAPILVLLALLATPAAAATCRPDPAAAPAVLAAVNAQRKANGLGPLAASDKLAAAAALFACEMGAAGRFYADHKGPRTGAIGRRAQSAGCRVKAVLAENIAYGFRDPGQVVALWMGSSGHRTNILNRKARIAGVAAVAGPNGPYWVLMVAGGC